MIGKKNINSLKIINDTAERAVKLMEEYIVTLTSDENQKQFIRIKMCSRTSENLPKL